MQERAASTRTSGSFFSGALFACYLPPLPLLLEEISTLNAGSRKLLSKKSRHMASCLMESHQHGQGNLQEGFQRLGSHIVNI